MLYEALTVLLLATLTVHGQDTCKDPLVEKRLLADDVRYASPFYVIALPRNTRTEQMDNVCYTYYENNGGAFFHIISITFKNGTNEYFTYTKGDLSERMGLAEAKATGGPQCAYHDYTLTPICNVSVFILYRCFTEGYCGNIDIGNTPGVDVRVVLAAHPKVNAECLQETQRSLKDTSTLEGGDYIILPQNLKPQCITKYNNTDSIGHQRAVGSKQVEESDLLERFGLEDKVAPAQDTRTPATLTNQQIPSNNPPTAQTTPKRNSFNPYGMKVGSSTQGNYNWGFQSTPRPGHTPSVMWPPNNGQWNSGPSPWGESGGTEQHYHMWQQPSTGPTKTSTTVRKNSNVFYHIHTWESAPPGCCRCN